MLYLVLRFNIRLCESHNHSHTVDITLYYTVFPMPHVEEANKIIVIVIEDVHKEHAKPTPEINLFTGASIEWQGYIDDTAPW